MPWNGHCDGKRNPSISGAWSWRCIKLGRFIVPNHRNLLRFLKDLASSMQLSKEEINCQRKTAFSPVKVCLHRTKSTWLHQIFNYNKLYTAEYRCVGGTMAIGMKSEILNLSSNSSLVWKDMEPLLCPIPQLWDN